MQKMGAVAIAGSPASRILGAASKKDVSFRLEWMPSGHEPTKPKELLKKPVGDSPVIFPILRRADTAFGYN
jgi:hypothetical protein